MPVTHCCGPLYDRTQTPDQHRLKALQRPIDERVFGGVAAAMAGCLRIDVTAVRIAFVVLALLGGAAVPLYAAGWLLIPAEGAELSVAQELARTLRRQ
jgi:phage shock protein PspC (stress-responsive transcriptional regulator)